MSTLSCRRCGHRIKPEDEECPKCLQPTKHGEAATAARLVSRRLLLGFSSLALFILLVWLIGRC